MDLKRLVFVSGKGGTGKTTIALILSRYLARQNKKILFVELGSQSSAQALLDLKQDISSIPQATPFGFDGCLIDGPLCLSEYISSYIKVEKITQTFFENPTIQSLINVAPGLNDLAMLGKLTSHLRNHGPGFDYDHVVVDAQSTGSFLSFLQAPTILGESVKSGPMHSQCQSIKETLNNPDFVQYILVSLLEDLPMDELIDSYLDLRPRFKNQLSVVVNKEMNLSETKGSDPEWSSFITKVIKEERVQKDRLSSLECDVRFIPFFTTTFENFLSKGSLYESL